jgi:hypothetical protein
MSFFDDEGCCEPAPPDENDEDEGLLRDDD